MNRQIPTQMGLQNLADVHPLGHAQRVENDVDDGPVLHVGHVLHRDYGGDHALVAVSSRHLVTGVDGIGEGVGVEGVPGCICVVPVKIKNKKGGGVIVV